MAEGQTTLGGGAELEGADVRDNVEEHNAGVEYEPLFSEEATFSEEQLTGEDDTGEETADPEPNDAKPDEKEGADPKEKAEPEKEEAKTEEKTETKEEEKEAKDDDTKEPPPGFVAQEALHEERQKRKSLKTELENRDTEIRRLTAELKTATTQKPDEAEVDEFKDFKVLSSAEFSDLLDGDPDKASKYQYQHTRYLEHLRQKEESQRAETEAKQNEENIVRSAGARIDEMLPGVFKGESELAIELGKFASENGVSPPVVDILTNPKTKIITEDGRNLLLGHGAAELVNLLKSSYEKVSGVPDVESLKAEIREQAIKEVTPEIEARLQKEIIAKLQSNPSDSFVSLDQVPGSDKKDSKPATSGILSESDYANMSESERAAMLGA